VGLWKVGGIGQVFSIANQEGRIQFDDFRLDPRIRHTVWTQVVGGTFVYLSLYAVNQAQVQRLLSVKSLGRAQMALWLQLLILFVLSFSLMIAGLVMFAYFRGCDPVSSGQIGSGDQLLPYFVMRTMAEVPGLPGLFVAGILSGSLSTVSSAINSLAAVTVEDYVRPVLIKGRFESQLAILDKHGALILKFIAFGYGLVCIATTFIAKALGSTVLQASLAVFGLVGGPLLGVFTLGMGFKRSNQPGAIAGFITSLALSAVMAFGTPKPSAPKLPVSTANCTVNVADAVTSSVTSSLDDYNFLFSVSYAWYAAVGFVVTLSVGLAVSWATKGCIHAERGPDQGLFFNCVKTSDEQNNQEMNKTQAAEEERIIED